MNGRLGVRIGGAIAVAACALLVACGGGGGGGGGTPPTAAPTLAPTVAPTSQSASLSLSTASSTQFSLGALSDGSGATVVSGATFTVPQVGIAGTIGSVTMTATVPSGNPTPSARTVHFRAPNTLNVATTPIVYFAFTVSKTVSVLNSPGIVLSGVSVTQPCYLVVFDPTNPNAGWNGLAGPFIASGGILTIPSTSLHGAFSIATGKTYIFAVVSSGGTVPTPTPIPSATIQAGTDAPMPTITGISGVPGAGWTPYQVASALKFPVLSGWSGVHQTIVILGDATPSPTDVSTFLSKVGLSSRAGGAMRTVNIDGGVNGSGNTNGDDGEAALDAEVALSMAPGAIIEFYAMPDLTEQSFIDAENHALTDPLKPAVISESFGGCEGSTVPGDHSIFQTAVSQKGMAITASSGDQGNECFTGTDTGGNPTYTPGPNNPASDPFVVGVGGNENVNAAQTGLGSLTSSQVWNDSYLSGPGASGGGVSALFNLPTYQSGLTGVASTSMRNVPDISMPAEGVAIYQAGWAQFGGTSWGAPLAAALIAQLDEYCGGVGPADASPVFFYNAFTRSSRAAYIDVTSGSNQFGSSTPFYRAAAGYDDTSGLGLPLGDAVATRMCPTRTWSFGVRSQAMEARATYGESRDTEIAAAVRLHKMPDLGARSNSAPTSVTLVLRNTATVANDEKTVISALQTAGFQITQTSENHLVIQAKAPASAVNTYFRTAMHDVYQGRYGQRYANVAPVTVPAAIAPYVSGVVANNLITRHRLSHRIR